MKAGLALVIVGGAVYLWAPLPFWVPGGLLVILGVLMVLNSLPDRDRGPWRDDDMAIRDPGRFWKEGDKYGP